MFYFCFLSLCDCTFLRIPLRRTGTTCDAGRGERVGNRGKQSHTEQQGERECSEVATMAYAAGSARGAVLRERTMA